ncbi:MAG: hypothetical protein JEZ02_09990 [Desulfatibacillum sp.]|nr:hypothetical protein [Desulfatibacillum sp.]
MEKNKWVRFGFILAGGVNVIGILIFSKFFTNDFMQTLDPAVCSHVGVFSIVLWGMAYVSVMMHFENAPFIVGVFAIEKFFYAIVWGRWVKEHFGDLCWIYQQDPITGFFYSIYGVNDFVFGVFFTVVFIMCIRKGTQHDAIGKR